MDDCVDPDQTCPSGAVWPEANVYFQTDSFHQKLDVLRRPGKIVWLDEKQGSRNRQVSVGQGYFIWVYSVLAGTFSQH